MIVSRAVLKNVYKKRTDWSRKGDFGRVLVIGGSYLYSGSPAFNALAAYRAGADLVTIFGPQCIADPVRSFSPDIIFYPYKNDFFSSKNIEQALDLANKNDVVVIGGGLTRTEETKTAARKFLSDVNKPCVVDADAIHSLVDSKVKLPKSSIITPHAYEFYVLTGKKVDNKISNRIKLVKDAAKKYNCTVLLKGHIDIISDGRRTAINHTGSPYMTKGGFGDTLAGICGALLARPWVDSFTAACAAAYINGAAGAAAAKKYGESTMASDLIKEIASVIK